MTSKSCQGILLAAIAFSTCILTNSNSFGGSKVIAVSKKAQTMWVDINCDGDVDRVTVSCTDSVLLLDVTLFQKSDSIRTTGLVFGLGNSRSSSSFCGKKVEMKTEGLNYDPEKFLDERPAGFKKSVKCKGIVLSDGMCDSFHIYWNHQDNDLACWRL